MQGKSRAFKSVPASVRQEIFSLPLATHYIQTIEPQFEWGNYHKADILHLATTLTQ